MDLRMISTDSFYPLKNFSEGKSENNIETNKGIKSFSQLIQDKLSEANSLQKEADKFTEQFLVGEPVEIDQLMLAMEKADLALRQMVEIRNKLIDAYKEISRMQV